MRKTIFHNNRSTSQNEDIKNLEQVSLVNQKVNVDIKKLLNRVKIKEKKEKKRKIYIFRGSNSSFRVNGNFYNIY